MTTREWFAVARVALVMVAVLVAATIICLGS